MNLISKNLLVTGGAGFIGSNFIKYLLSKYNNLNIINLDALTYAGNLNNLKSIEKNPNYKFIQGNICDKDLVNDIFLKNQIDGVINFAAETHVDNSILNPDVFVKTNVNGVFNLLNVAYNFWMKNPFQVKNKFKLARFHQISTDEVYGSIDKGSFTEQSRYAPNSPYSASKASADMIVRSFNRTYGLNTTISISSNNFGSNQNNEKFIPTIINSIINNKSIPVYGDGKNIRDWISVEDHCSAIDLIFNNSISGQIYNVGGCNELTNLEIIQKIHQAIINIKSEYSNNDLKIQFIKDRYGHDRRYSLDISKIKKDLNWCKLTDFNESIIKMIPCYL